MTDLLTVFCVFKSANSDNTQVRRLKVGVRPLGPGSSFFWVGPNRRTIFVTFLFLKIFFLTYKCDIPLLREEVTQFQCQFASFEKMCKDEKNEW